MLKKIIWVLSFYFTTSWYMINVKRMNFSLKVKECSKKSYKLHLYHQKVFTTMFWWLQFEIDFRKSSSNVHNIRPLTAWCIFTLFDYFTLCVFHVWSSYGSTWHLRDDDIVWQTKSPSWMQIWPPNWSICTTWLKT